MSVADLDPATRLAIEEHPRLYVDATVRNDIDQFIDRFTEDAFFDASKSFPGIGFPLEGRDAIREFSKQMMGISELACQQLHGVIIYEYERNTARIRYHLSEIGKMPDGEMEVAMGIYYDDLVLCDDGIWRMNRHILHPVYAYTPKIESFRMLVNENPRSPD